MQYSNSLRQSPSASSLPFQRTVAMSAFASSKTRPWSLSLLFTEAVPLSTRLWRDGNQGACARGAERRVAPSNDAPTHTCTGPRQRLSLV